MWLSLSTASWANQGHQQTPKSRQGIRWKYTEPRCRPAKRLYCRLWSDKIICFCVPKSLMFLPEFRLLFVDFAVRTTHWHRGGPLEKVSPKRFNFFPVKYSLNNDLKKMNCTKHMDLAESTWSMPGITSSANSSSKSHLAWFLADSYWLRSYHWSVKARSSSWK